MKFLNALLFSLILAFTASAALAGPVNINTADAKTLATEIKGVGPKTAEAIVAYRTKHGPFKRIDDLAKVKGIGQQTLTKNRDNLTLGQAPAQPAK